MTLKQKQVIVLWKPARDVSKNFYVEFEGRDFPEVREKLYALGWEKGVGNFESATYYSAQFYPPKGSMIFGGHTPAEKSKYVKQFKKVLRDCNIQEYDEAIFTWRDLF